MRRKYYCVIVAALMLSLAGCGLVDKQDNQKEQGNITTEASQKDQDTVTTEHEQAQAKDEKLTLEYVCEEFNIDESEFDGVDFDAFVSYYGLTYENIGGGDPRFLLNDYKELQDKTEIPDYAALKITTNKFLPEYQDKIETVIVEHVEGETCQTIVIDLKLGKVVTTNGSIENLSADDTFTAFALGRRFRPQKYSFLCEKHHKIGKKWHKDNPSSSALPPVPCCGSAGAWCKSGWCARHGNRHSVFCK